MHKDGGNEEIFSGFRKQINITDLVSESNFCCQNEAWSNFKAVVRIFYYFT